MVQKPANITSMMSERSFQLINALIRFSKFAGKHNHDIYTFYFIDNEYAARFSRKSVIQYINLRTKNQN